MITSMNIDKVLVVGKTIYEAGQHHRWGGFEQPFEELGPIERNEFLGIIERALAKADKIETAIAGSDIDR